MSIHPFFRGLRAALPAIAVVTAACSSGSADKPAARGFVTYSAQTVARSPAEANFTAIPDLDVDQRGRVYVADVSGEITVLDPAAQVLRRVGQQGYGPGEFQSVTTLRVLQGDSLFAFDPEANRVTVFPPGSRKAAYTVNVGTNSMLFPYLAHPLDDRGGLLAVYRAAWGDYPGREQNRPRVEVVRLLNADGSVRRDSVLTLREPVTMTMIAGKVNGVMFDPFRRHTALAVGREGRVYSAWNESLRFAVYSSTGRKLREFDAAVAPAPRPVTGAELDSIAKRKMGMFPEAMVRRALREKAPKTWPPFNEMLEDDRGRLWVGLLGGRGEPTKWTALDESGAPVASLTLPANVSVRLIRGEIAYAVETDEDDVPHVVIYALTPQTPAPARS